jgi:hypothetical protein
MVGFDGGLAAAEEDGENSSRGGGLTERGDCSAKRSVARRGDRSG